MKVNLFMMIWFFFSSDLRLVLRRHYCLAIRICDYLKTPKGEGASRILGHWACYKVSMVSVHCGNFHSSSGCKLFIREFFPFFYPTNSQNLLEVFQLFFSIWSRVNLSRIQFAVCRKGIQMFLVIVKWLFSYYFYEPCWAIQGFRKSFVLFIHYLLDESRLRRSHSYSTWNSCGQLVASLEDELQSA